jgi:hypothetical protein
LLLLGTTMLHSKSMLVPMKGTMPNITVKAATAFGLPWTSRKRATPYLKR